MCALQETTFIESIENSSNALIGEHILSGAEKYIKDVRGNRALHVITNNYTSNMAMENMLKKT